MEKRFIFAFILTFILLITYQQIFYKKVPGNLSEKSEPQTQPNQSQSPALFSTDIIEQGLELPTAEIGFFHITYSPTGGYIKNISLKEYNEELLYKNIGFIPQQRDKRFNAQISENRIVFSADDGDKKEFIFQDYVITVKSDTFSSDSMLLFAYTFSTNMLDQRYQELFYSLNHQIVRKGFKKIPDSQMDNIEFAGGRDRYFCIALLKNDYSIKWSRDKTNVFLSVLLNTKEISFYAGPQKYSALKSVNLEEIIDYGFFHSLALFMNKVLHFLHQITRNWGTSIILLAILIYGILSPFTMKSTKAMKKIQEIQPQIEELKQKHKDNPQKLQKELMELYKNYKINPLGGCLPMFFQLPVIFALYQVFLRSLELKGANFLWIKDLAAPERAWKLPFPPPVNYLNILPILIVILGIIQQKITMSTSSVSSEQKSMGMFFAVFMGVIFYNFPSCLVLYWLIQTFLTLLYQIRLKYT